MSYSAFRRSMARERLANAMAEREPEDHHANCGVFVTGTWDFGCQCAELYEDEEYER